MVNLTDAQQQAILDSVRTPGPNAARERFELHIKPAFNTDDGTQFDDLLSVFAAEFDAFEDELDATTLGRFIDGATNRQLDKYGEYLQLPRLTAEDDTHYRGRLKTQLAALTGGGTIWAIKQTGASLLGVDPAEIVIEEDFETEPARFSLLVDERHFDAAEVSPTDFRDFLETARAAGVRVEAQALGEFTHRTEADFLGAIDDPSKGYDTLDGEGNPQGNGGTYTTLF